MLTFRLDHQGKDDNGMQHVQILAEGGELSPLILGFGHDQDGDRAEALAMQSALEQLGTTMRRALAGGGMPDADVLAVVRAWFRPPPPPAAPEPSR